MAAGNDEPRRSAEPRLSQAHRREIRSPAAPGGPAAPASPAAPRAAPAAANRLERQRPQPEPAARRATGRRDLPEGLSEPHAPLLRRLRELLGLVTAFRCGSDGLATLAAVTPAELRQAGLTTADLEDLLRCGLLESARTSPDVVTQWLRRVSAASAPSTANGSVTHIELTPAGAAFLQRASLLVDAVSSADPGKSASAAPLQTARSASAAALQAAGSASAVTPQDAEPAPLVRPSWHARKRELWYGDVLVKRMRRASPNQELVLAAFEEEGWPPRIDDPLPQRHELVPSVRLHNTVNRLNSHMQAPSIIFGGDGTGHGICWRPR